MQWFKTLLITLTLAISGLTLTNAALADTPLININTATVEEFTQLKGIGKAKAQAIVAHREQAGEFKSLEELTLVKGIGMATLEKNRELLTLGSGTPVAQAEAPAATTKQ